MLQKNLKFAVLVTVFASTVGLWLACDFEKVGPREPSAIKIASILEELANSRTQAEAEIAISHLLEKTGVGISVKGSNYGDHILPANFIATLAEEHLLFLKGEYNWTWEEMFEIEKLLSEDEWILPVTFEDAAARLQKEATSALADPENPNNALLLVIVAQGATVPTTISAFDKTATISPVQESLFEIWTDYAFGKFESQKTSHNRGVVKFKFTFVECHGDKASKTITVKHEEPFFNKKQKKCLEEAKEEYEDDVKKCFKKHDKKKKCLKLKECLEEAFEDVQEEIKECGKFHDQGGGD